VRLTALGLAAVEELTGAFDALAGAEARLRGLALPREVHIATLPAIAQLWLSPRLPALRAAAPEISVSITALEAAPNLKRSLHDLSLFPGTSGGRLLADDALFPVCSPGLAAGLTRVEDLGTVPCLSDTAWDRDWEVWLQAVGAKVQVRGPVFSLYALAVEEAVNGAGVLMGHGPLVAGHLARGALVAPFRQRVVLAGWRSSWVRGNLRDCPRRSRSCRWCGRFRWPLAPLRYRSGRTRRRSGDGPGLHRPSGRGRSGWRHWGR
jgi:DNA-binding transcriptional LysR family regulator